MLPLLTTPPMLDGLPEAGAVALPTATLEWHRDDAGSITAETRVAATGDGLYVYVRATDDVFVPGRGITGDHVEVWFADPRMLDEARGIGVAEAGAPREVRAALREVARDTPEQHLVIPAVGAALRTVPRESAVSLRSTTVACDGGWCAEVLLPWTELRRIGSPVLDAIALHVDVVDADGDAPQDRLIGTGPRGSFTTLRLDRPLRVADDDVWTSLGVAPEMLLREGGAWTAGFRGYAWIGDEVVPEPIAGLDGPVVTLVDGPVPLRVVDAVLQARGAEGWTELADGRGGRLGTGAMTAAWQGRYLVSVGETSSRDVPGPGLCGAGVESTWTVWEIVRGELTPVFEASDGCLEPGPTCALSGDRVDCDEDGDHTAFLIDRKRAVAVPVALDPWE